MFDTIRVPGPLAAGAAGAALALALSAPSAFAAEEGLQVVRDAKTGQLRAPQGNEITRLQGREPVARGLLTGKIAPKVRVLPSGAKAMELTSEQMSYSVVTRSADGKLNMYCVPNQDEADKLVQGHQTVATAQEHTHEEK